MKKVFSLILLTTASSYAGDGRFEISMATLPLTITNPGSYIVTENLIVTNGFTDAITVLANDVVLDLNGFTLNGTGFSGFNDAIEQDTGSQGLTVKNGTIRNWTSGFTPTSYAIRAPGSANSFSDLKIINTGYGISSGDQSSFFRCVAVSNAGYGTCNALFGGPNSVFEDCIAAANTALGVLGPCYGINAGRGSTLTRCTAYDNRSTADGAGILAGQGSTLENCASYYNTFTQAGYGIQALENCVLRGCATYDNLSQFGQAAGIFAAAHCSIHECSAGTNRANASNGFGILAGAGSTISGCAANHNSGNAGNGTGISAGEGSRVSGCVANDNFGGGASGFGITAGNGSRIADCSAKRNSGSAFGLGLQVGVGSSIEGCSAWNNGTNAAASYGILADNRSSVLDCTSTGNKDAGIFLDSDCVARGNTCVNNVNAAGLQSQGSRNRIEDNHVTGNNRGLQLGGSNSVVTGNTVLNNVDNYNISGSHQLNLLLGQIPETIDWSARVTLAGSLTGTSGTNGLTLNASDITVDLAGHALRGVPGSLDGVSVPSLVSNIVIRNGAFTGWGGDGVDADLAIGGQIENVAADNNGARGMAFGALATIQNSRADNNQDVGIYVSDNSRIEKSIAVANGDDGILALFNSSVVDCETRGNSGDGIEVNLNGLMLRCAAIENTGNGINASNSASVIDSCSTVGNGADGITAGPASRILKCRARGNAANGIHLQGDLFGHGGEVSECDSSRNHIGINAGAQVALYRNSCNDNGRLAAGVGIYMGGLAAYSRIEGNFCANNSTGIYVCCSPNLALNNYSKGNTDDEYDMNAGVTSVNNY